MDACTCHKTAPRLNGLGNAYPINSPEPYYPQTVFPAPAQQQNPDTMSVKEALALKFDLIGLEGKWLELIGEACKPTSFFIYGEGGSGKSTFTLEFANYMAGKGNRVLYAAGEQFNTPVFTKMLQRLHITDRPGFVLVKNLHAQNPGNFDIIVLDSKDSLETDINAFRALRKRFPTQSYVILSQATKDGNFTGSEKWRNEVDTMIVCEKGIAYTNRDKNRWGGSGEMKIF